MNITKVVAYSNVFNSFTKPVIGQYYVRTIYCQWNLSTNKVKEIVSFDIFIFNISKVYLHEKKMISIVHIITLKKKYNKMLKQNIDKFKKLQKSHEGRDDECSVLDFK